jgi:Family of unknown function (DUF6254)
MTNSSVFAHDKNVAGKGGFLMTKSKHEKERQWNVRKEDQKPHGKVPSFKELSQEDKQK